MSQTNQQEQGAAAAKPEARKHWELFWRIIAGLMLIIIAWIAWVLYQITPRSVVTPLAYEPRVKAMGTPQAAAGVGPPAASPSPISPAPLGAPSLSAAPRAAEAAAADVAMDQAQTAARAGAHQSSADVQAAALGNGQEKVPEKEQFSREGLKLSTEITTPLAEKKRIPGKQKAKSGSD